MSKSRTSIPSTLTEPPVTSYIRQISDSSVDLPDPVDPTIAVVRAGQRGQRNILQDRAVGAAIAECR